MTRALGLAGSLAFSLVRHGPPGLQLDGRAARRPVRLESAEPSLDPTAAPSCRLSSLLVVDPSAGDALVPMYHAWRFETSEEMNWIMATSPSLTGRQRQATRGVAS